MSRYNILSNAKQLPVVTQNVLEKAEVEALLKNVLAHEKVHDVVRVDISQGSQKGDGFMSSMTNVKVTGNKILNFVIKRAPKAKKVRQLTSARSLYLREIYVYERVLPVFKQFQVDRNVMKPFEAYPKIYKTYLDENDECLIMEDIRKRGFRLWSHDAMTHEHVAMVFEQYAKFHAVSYAMKALEPHTFEILMEPAVSCFKLLRTECPQNIPMLNTLDKYMTLYPENSYAFKAIANFRANIVEFFEGLSVTDKNRSVFNHADSWSNNIMFKYADVENPLKPTEMSMLDFQIAFVTTPVVDLSYFFYVGASHKILANLDAYLKIYHDTLTQRLNAMSVETPISLEDLRDDWKTYSRFGLSMCLMPVKTLLSEPEEVTDYQDVTNQNLGLADMVTRDIRKSSILCERLRNIVNHFVEHKFI